MNAIKKLHRDAMEHIDQALVERMNGNEEGYIQHTVNAMELESSAANMLYGNLEAEPTRSVLFRSAATLAHNCGKFSDAERLIYKGLSGNPPVEIEEELTDLLGQVNFRRHMELRGVELVDSEIQMTITGNSVGFGMAATDVFLNRVETTENIIFRTAERWQKKPYRDRGRKNSKLSRDVELYMSVPRAACFAVTFRVGASLQQSLPGMSFGEDVITEVLDCLSLYTEGDNSELRKKITEEAYYRNFVGLARNLQPDGSKVDMVGFTAIRNGLLRQVAMTRSMPDEFEQPAQAISLVSIEEDVSEEPIRLRGILKLANSLKKQNEIQILVNDNTKVKIIVPPGMMSDIVKPLWDSEVEVLATKSGKKINLMQIKPA